MSHYELIDWAEKHLFWGLKVSPLRLNQELIRAVQWEITSSKPIFNYQMIFSFSSLLTGLAAVVLSENKPVFCAEKHSYLFLFSIIHNDSKIVFQYVSVPFILACDFMWFHTHIKDK